MSTSAKGTRIPFDWNFGNGGYDDLRKLMTIEELAQYPGVNTRMVRDTDKD